MSKLNWISDLSKSEVHAIVKSIDTVLFDIDGVLIRNRSVIPDADKAVAKFRDLGKKIVFVTNNSVYSQELLAQNLRAFEASVDEIVSPNQTLLAYLKKIDFKKDIYVISTSLPKKLLKEAGHNVIDYADIQPEELEASVSAMKQLSLKTLDLCKNVGIVYLDSDINCHHGAIQVAKIILNYIDDVKLLSGMNDDLAPMDGKMNFICGKYYIDGMERWTGRKALEMAKPGQELANIIESKFGITDKSHVLMIGDNVPTDIAFGVNAGYKTCLVLSGIWKKSQVENWPEAEEWKPDYVASSLADIYEKIHNM